MCSELPVQLGSDSPSFLPVSLWISLNELDPDIRRFDLKNFYDCGGIDLFTVQDSKWSLLQL
jgi:hypothetical protein